MRRITRSGLTFSALALFIIASQMLYTGHIVIGKSALPMENGTVYWANCVNLSREQAIRRLNPEPRTLDGCYQNLLAMFGMKFLSDITPDPLKFFTSLQPIKQSSSPGSSLPLDVSGNKNYSSSSVFRLQKEPQSQRASVVQLFIQQGNARYSAVQEKLEIASVDVRYVDQGKVDPALVKGYNAAVNKPLFDQFVRQQLQLLSSQQLDQWFTNAILAIPTIMKQACDKLQPSYNPPPRVDPPNSGDNGDVAYHDGHVVDGIANIYLVFWIDNSFQTASPKYVSVVTQFVKDIGHSPLYANLIQYSDALGRCPMGAKLAGTFVDHRPFPADLVAKRNDPNLATDKNLQQAMGTLTDQVWRKELADVAAQKGWNTQDYHNFFIMLPTMSWGCGYHSHLTINGVPDVGPPGSPWASISYPYYDGQEQCAVVPQSPNGDHVADIATGIISHELSEGIADTQPSYKLGWDEIADKCPLPSSTIDPQTHGNVTWNGHHYAIQEEYSNLRHGCILKGP